MVDFKLGEAALPVLFQPGLDFDQLGVDLFRNESVALAEEADEVRPAAIDLRQTDGQDLAPLGLLLGDPPAQIDFDKLHAAFPTAPPQLREGKLHQPVPFFLHVAKGGGDEDADAARVFRGGHGRETSLWYPKYKLLYREDGEDKGGNPPLF